MAYPIAPWIRPAGDIAGDYVGGIRAGAEIAHQQAALAQEANLRSMEMNLKQQQLARENALQQQQLEITKAYHDQQTSLMRQRLEQASAMTQLKTQEAARRYAATQAYQSDLASGKPMLESILKNFPGTDESMTGYGQLARQLLQDQKPMPPPSVLGVQVGDRTIPFLKVPEANGGYRLQSLRPEGRDVQSDRLLTMRIRELERNRDKISDSLEKDPFTAKFEAMSPEEINALNGMGRAQYAAYRSKKARLEQLDQAIDSAYMGDNVSLGGSPPTAPEGVEKAGPKIKSIRRIDTQEDYSGAPPEDDSLGIRTPPGFGGR